MAREFISTAFRAAGRPLPEAAFSDPASCSQAIAQLDPNPEWMFWFEYNFLFVLAAEGKAEKEALGDHSPKGYRQRRRFYTISEEGRLRFARNVAAYILFLAESTGLVTKSRCREAQKRLQEYTSLGALLRDIPPPAAR